MNKENIFIDKSEVLRYMGYKGQKIDNILDKTIDSAIEEIKEISNPKYIYKEYSLGKPDGIITFENSSISLSGNSINKHLKNSTIAVVMAATLGNIVDAKIRYYEKIDMQKAIILDACATEFIEKICDYVEEEIRDKFKNQGRITFRYSPGYGDLTLDCQKSIIESLRADKFIGLTCNRCNLLIPRKSVTAIIGIVDNGKDISNIKGCEYCKLNKTCAFRKGGKVCGNR